MELYQRNDKIQSDHTIVANLGSVLPLQANDRLCSPGVKLHGAGFVVTPAEAHTLGHGNDSGLAEHIRPYRNGRDLAARARGAMAIDLYQLPEVEVRHRFAAGYQWGADRVKPERDQKNRKVNSERRVSFGT